MPPSTLDPDEINPVPASRVGVAGGHDIGSLGPSNSSDTGSDRIGAPDATREFLDSDTDDGHTGEDTSVDETVRADRDDGFDRVVDASEAGLGGGLDEAEEALRDHPEPGVDPLRASRASRRNPLPSRATASGSADRRDAPSSGGDRDAPSASDGTSARDDAEARAAGETPHRDWGERRDR